MHLKFVTFAHFDWLIRRLHLNIVVVTIASFIVSLVVSGLRLDDLVDGRFITCFENVAFLRMFVESHLAIRVRVILRLNR